MSRPNDLVRLTPAGLYCEAGGFHVDPWLPVPRAVVTHAHGDHARPGHESHLAAASGADILRARLGPIRLDAVPYGEVRTVGDVRVSLHPAGHIRGSAQVRIERGGEVWVVTGDYKLRPDPVSEAFEPVRCDVLVSECTFGLPIYRWPETGEVRRGIHAWWARNREEGRTSVLYAYALGKAQHVLSLLDPAEGPILAHGAVQRMNAAHRAAGVELPPTRHADAGAARETRGSALVLAPPSAGGSTWIRKFGPVSTAFASGWMRVRGVRRRRAADRGFVLSDHADWTGILDVVRESGADRVGLTHGKTAAMVRYLRENGWDAWEIPTRFEGEADVDEGTVDPEVGGAPGDGDDGPSADPRGPGSPGP